MTTPTGLPSPDRRLSKPLAESHRSNAFVIMTSLLQATRWSQCLEALFIALLITGLLLSGCKRAHQDNILLADKLAAHPDDPSKPAGVSGVPDANFQSPETIEAAVNACVDAIKADPKEPRYQFELGRVLLLGGMIDESREHLEAAAQQGYAAAYFYMGGLELDAAKGFFQQASAAKFKPADKLVGDLKSIDAFGQRRTNWLQGLAFTLGGLAAVGVIIFLLVRRRRAARPPVSPQPGSL
jgi:hypothetical protein